MMELRVHLSSPFKSMFQPQANGLMGRGGQNYFFPASPDSFTSSTSPQTVINCNRGARQDHQMTKKRQRTTIPSPLTANTACQFCLETFVPDGKWPPKVLPCGHNFCDECIQSLCLYTEYYLLDFMRCPKCQQPCEVKIAVQAPTNRILCKKLQCNTEKATTSNVTVIHVSGNARSKPTSDKEQPQQDVFPSKPMPYPSATAAVEGAATVNLTAKSGQPNCKQPSWNCYDCKRRLSAKSIKSLNAISRFCDCNLAKAVGIQKFKALTCLQCCVDRHNGHSLLTLIQLEKENHKLMHELRQINQRLEHFSLVFQEKEGQASKTDLSSVVHAKQMLMRESKQCYDKFTLLLENHFLRSLPSDQVSAIRSRLLSGVNRLQRMCSWLEEDTCTQSSGNKSTLRSNNLAVKDDSIKVPFKSNLKSSGVATAAATISTLLHLYCNCCEEDVKEQYRLQFSSLEKNVNVLGSSFGEGCGVPDADEPVFELLKDSIRLINAILDERIAPEMLLLFESAFLHTFKALNSLSKKPRCVTNMPERRQQLWKLVQTSFSELLRITSLHWSSANVDRVEVVGDLALLCSVFADVCDTATVLLCMIEAARARASWQSNTRLEADNEHCARRMEAQLKEIDENLMECRRIQKLNELCSQTRVIKPTQRKKKKAQIKSDRPKWFWNRWLVTRKYSVGDFKV